VSRALTCVLHAVVVKDCFAFHIPDAVHSLRLSTDGDAVIDRKRAACPRAAARPITHEAVIVGFAVSSSGTDFRGSGQCDRVRS
jgi:hypothetical protein